MKFSEMSKSKLFAILLFCIYLICGLINSDIFPYWYLFSPIGLLFIWIGDRYGITRMRKHGIPRLWTLTGWMCMLYPLFSALFSGLRLEW